MNVLLVDDETITIRMLQALINWEELDLHVIGSASDGREAYEIIKESKPDIVICDIKMPEMDGLELLRKIMSIRPETKVIMMSAYADFSYVKEAIKYGSCDYILKPVDEMELVQTLRRMISEIQGERAYKRVIASSEKQLDQISIYHFMRTGHGREKAKMALENNRLRLKKYALFMLQEDNGTIDEYNDANNLEMSQEGYRLAVMENILMELQIQSMVFSLEEAVWTVILDDIYSVRREKIAEAICQKWREKTDSKISVCFSCVGEDFSELPDLYKEINSLSKYRFYIGEEMILGYGYNCNKTELNEVRNIGIMREIEMLVNNYDKEQLISIVDEIFVLSPQYNFNEVGFVCEICYHILFLLRKQMNGQENAYQELCSITYEQLTALPSLKALKEKMLQIIELAFEQLKVSEVKKYSKVVRESIEYMEAHYDRNISLEEICTKIAISKNYFCYLFKRETGMNLWNYLTIIRLEQGKQLLEQTDLKSYEIALQVGYDNPSYFSKLFKKYEGMTPNEYRKKISKGDEK